MEKLLFILICSFSTINSELQSSTQTLPRKKRRRDVVRATKKGIEKAKVAKRDVERMNEPSIVNRTDELGVSCDELGLISNTSESTVKRFLQGKYILRECAVTILRKLHLEPSEILEQN